VFYQEIDRLPQKGITVDEAKRIYDLYIESDAEMELENLKPETASEIKEKYPFPQSSHSSF